MPRCKWISLPEAPDGYSFFTFYRETTLPRNLRSYLPDSKVILPTNEVYFDDKFTGTPAATHYTCLGPGKKGSTLISLNREPEMTSFFTKHGIFDSKVYLASTTGMRFYSHSNSQSLFTLATRYSQPAFNGILIGERKWL